MELERVKRDAYGDIMWELGYSAGLCDAKPKRSKKKPDKNNEPEED